MIISPLQVALILAVVLGILGVFKIQQKRELANSIARRYCEQNELQLLDGTVAFRGLHLNWVQLNLVYRFDFAYSLNITDRFTGSISLVGKNVESIYTEQNIFPS